MAMFVHLAPASRIAVIRRNGVSRLRRAAGDFPGGVFAVPVTRNFFVSHQWLRELKRRNQGPIAAVYFRVPEDAQGWEVVIPRRVEADELHRVRQLSQVVGWRFSPESKGKPPFCTCKFC